jgi:hypothetical protein
MGALFCSYKDMQFWWIWQEERELFPTFFNKPFAISLKTTIFAPSFHYFGIEF